VSVALVTGGSRGIGAAIAAHLAGSGWRVVTADLDPGSAPPPGGRYAACDVADERSVNALLTGVAAQEGRLDALVCNANLTSTYLLTRAGEPMLRAANGSVVTIASTRAHMSEPHTEAYAASKGGLVAFTHALAVSLGPDIRVNCISPGWIVTKGDPPRPEDHAFHPAGRVGTPQDIAALVAFLVGPDSGFITGAEFIVDGGVTRKMIYPE
jgi:hypothetical protein